MQSQKYLVKDKLPQQLSPREMFLKLVFQINILIQKNPSKIDFERAGAKQGFQSLQSIYRYGEL
jgi:hypothetical protein